MNAFRQILKDRVAGAGALAIIVQLLLIQALVTSFTCSAMATASFSAGTGFVICHGGAAEETAQAGSSSHRRGPGGVCLDCPCGIASTTGQAVLAFFAPDRDLGPAYTLVAEALGRNRVDADLPPASPPLDLKPDPTGPPFFFA